MHIPQYLIIAISLYGIIMNVIYHQKYKYLGEPYIFLSVRLSLILCILIWGGFFSQFDMPQALILGGGGFCGFWLCVASFFERPSYDRFGFLGMAVIFHILLYLGHWYG